MKKGWAKKALGDLLEIQNGFAFDSKRFSTSKGMPLIRIRDLKNGMTTEINYDGDYDDRFVVSAGDLLIGMDGEFRCYEWAGGKALLNQRVCRLQNFHSTLDPRFVLYGVNSYLKEIEDETAFTTVKHLSAKRILGIEFPVPPLTEQRRIVAILDEAFEGIAAAKANAEKNLLNAREVFESKLALLFTHEVDRWPERRMADVCREITVGHVGSMKGEYRETGVPFLRSQNIRRFEVTLENVVYVSQQFHRSLKKSILRPGDLAIVRTGYPGTTAVVPESLPEANCSDLVIMRVGESVDPSYIAAFLNSSYGRHLVGSQLVGAAQKHFNVTAAKQVALRVPPLPEQARVVERVMQVRNQLQACEVILTRKEAALDELKASLLHQAFSGAL